MRSRFGDQALLSLPNQRQGKEDESYEGAGIDGERRTNGEIDGRGEGGRKNSRGLHTFCVEKGVGRVGGGENARGSLEYTRGGGVGALRRKEIWGRRERCFFRVQQLKRSRVC